VTLHAAPEPAVSPTASARLPGRIVTLDGAPEGIAITADGQVAVNVRKPNGVVLFPIASPLDRHFVSLAGTARHLTLAGPNGPLNVPDESDNTFIELALPSGKVIESVAVGDHPHDAISVGAHTDFVADELGNEITILRDGKIVRTVPAPLQPGGMAANPAGTLAVVVGVRGRRITEYTATGNVIGSANCGAGPTHAVTGDDGLYWVADTNGGNVLGFELGPHGPVQVATIPVGPRPYGVAFDTRQDTLWVTITGADELVGLHLDGTKVKARTTFDTVRQPNTVAVDPTTGELAVTGSTQPGAIQLLDIPSS
jgi:DNA-binding beta-propeller fold protein YncE